MAIVSKIGWTHSTFNPWRGCVEVSPACDNCYAATMAKRNPAVLGVWGDKGTRVVAAEKYWREPLKWNKQAAETGQPHRVFCASLADVFEDWKGPMIDASGTPIRKGFEGNWVFGGGILRNDFPLTMQDVRVRLFNLIDQTPHLTWLLLTKRPESIAQMIYATYPESSRAFHELPQRLRSNLWLGTTVENQLYAEKRIPELLKCRDLAPVLFLSCEPLLGEVQLNHLAEHHIHPGWPDQDYTTFNNCLNGFRTHKAGGWTDKKFKVDWVIAGDESGSGRRKTDVEWSRSLRDQCKSAGVAFFMKQMDVNGEISDEPSEFPEDLRIQEFPS